MTDLESGPRTGLRTAPAPPRRRRRRAGMYVLAFSALFSLALIWVYFQAFRPSMARFSLDEHFWFYPIVMVHMVGSSVALGAVVFQVWPWFRRTRPRAHRRIGKVYVWVGIYPACLTSALLLAFWPEPLINEASDILTTVLWFVTTAFGAHLAKQGRVAEHRRWMLRSFALTMSFTVSIALLPPISLLFQAALYTHFDGDQELMSQAAAGVQVWASWILPLIAVEWWSDLQRLRRGRALADAPGPAGRESVAAVEELTR